MISKRKYDNLVAMIQGGSATPNAELEALKKEVQTLKTDLATANGKVKALEDAKTTLEGKVAALEAKHPVA